MHKENLQTKAKKRKIIQMVRAKINMSTSSSSRGRMADAKKETKQTARKENSENSMEINLTTK